MKNLILVGVLALLSQYSFAQFTLSQSIYNAHKEPFISHEGPGIFDTYLTMEIPYSPVKKLFKEFSQRNALELITRGEAHITVVTPPEYYDELRSYISMSEINEIALKMGIQNSQFTIKCLGSGSKEIEGKVEKTFYLVVESDDLLNIRKKILQDIQSRGGSPALFKPEKFYPHITLGYTKRDLHESDGVFKDMRSCIELIEIE